MAEDSIFTKIIKGEIPCQKIYEDEHTIAFLDIHPVQPAHTLVVPKKQVEFAWDMEDTDYQALMATVQKIALHLRDKVGTKYVGIRIEGTDVPHAHVHVVPFNTPDEFHFRPDMSLKPEFAALDALAEKLRLQ